MEGSSNVNKNQRTIWHRTSHFFHFNNLIKSGTVKWQWRWPHAAIHRLYLFMIFLFLIEMCRHVVLGRFSSIASTSNDCHLKRCAFFIPKKLSMNTPFECHMTIVNYSHFEWKISIKYKMILHYLFNTHPSTHTHTYNETRTKSAKKSRVFR